MGENQNLNKDSLRTLLESIRETPIGNCWAVSIYLCIGISFAQN